MKTNRSKIWSLLPILTSFVLIAPSGPNSESTLPLLELTPAMKAKNEPWDVLSAKDLDNFRVFFENGKLVNSQGQPITVLESVYNDAKETVTHFKPIFIVNDKGELYLSKAVESGKVMFHPYLSQGKPIITAGEIEVKDGSIIYISNKSGHYHPSKESLDQGLKYLSEKNHINIQQNNVIHYFKPDEIDQRLHTQMSRYNTPVVENGRLIGARSDSTTLNKHTVLDPCEEIHLDAKDQSAEKLPVYDQLEGICFAIVGTALGDAYRFSNGDPNPNHLSSPLIAAIDYHMSFFELAEKTKKRYLAYQKKFELLKKEGAPQEEIESASREIALAKMFADMGEKQAHFESAKGISGGNPYGILDVLSEKGSCDAKLVDDIVATQNKDLVDASTSKTFLDQIQSLKTLYDQEIDQCPPASLSFRKPSPNQLIQTKSAIQIRKQLINRKISPILIPTVREITDVLSFGDITKFSNAIKDLLSERCESHRKKFSIPHAVMKLTSNHEDLIKFTNHVFDSKNQPIQPFGIEYCSDFLKLSMAPKSCPRRHASIVIGQRRDKDGTCLLQIQNSWGKNCQDYDFPCQDGKIWVPKSTLADYLGSVIYLPPPNDPLHLPRLSITPSSNDTP